MNHQIQIAMQEFAETSTRLIEQDGFDRADVIAASLITGMTIAVTSYGQETGWAFVKDAITLTHEVVDLGKHRPKGEAH